MFTSPPSKSRDRRTSSVVPPNISRAWSGVSPRGLEAQPLFNKDVFKGRKFVLDPMAINGNDLDACKQLLEVLHAVSTVHTALSCDHFVFYRPICSPVDSAGVEWQ
jgi:hypothetical protein